MVYLANKSRLCRSFEQASDKITTPDQEIKNQKRTCKKKKEIKKNYEIKTLNKNNYVLYFSMILHFNFYKQCEQIMTAVLRL